VQHERVEYLVVRRPLGGTQSGERFDSPEDATERADELAEETGSAVEVHEVIVHADGTSGPPRIVYVTG
jgi:hypothetical protein